MILSAFIFTKFPKYRTYIMREGVANLPLHSTPIEQMTALFSLLDDINRFFDTLFVTRNLAVVFRVSFLFLCFF